MEIALQFPYLTKMNENGIILSGDSVGKLDQLINYGQSPIKVTLYPSKSELNYALSTTVRYSTIDPVFVVGEISGFDPTNGKVYIKVYNDNDVELVKSGKVLPRMLGTKVKDGSTIKMKTANLISLDILQQ